MCIRIAKAYSNETKCTQVTKATAMPANGYVCFLPSMPLQ